ncbi:aldehyde dehydrogenase family protein [Ktedonosporobacter rubrisoli]|uniref:Aldehyde dehydrogenase family protein n=1 Tax=Ktedonosporobacter rubrisoli TaxID=2509675 RepID=A0A4P6K299_KTERU|nr:aldehyde dehydrogenase family protein [Ktedonosporobacter rubrisoli]QBD81830.1 aldehyde dehydrogenase family protein [Ktedonosporobacter rubrisoli]
MQTNTPQSNSGAFPLGNNHRLFIAGEWVDADDHVEIRFPYERKVLVGRVAWANKAHVETALTAAKEGAKEMAAWPLHRRAALLQRIADLIAANKERFAWLIVHEVGKPIKDAYLEIDRAIAAVRLSAEEATRIHGEVIPMDAVPSGEGRIAYTVRRPLGIIAGITGFNFPLLLDCHKIAPALAAGNAIVLKPAPDTPITALELAALCAQAGTPRGALSVLPGGDEIGEALVRDERVAMITFTGSSAVGQHIRAVAGYKRVALELGNNSPLIIEPDANLERAIARVLAGGYYAVGQACIAVQRIYAHRSIYKEFARRLAEQVGKMRTGDPRLSSTDSSTLVSEQATQRVLRVIQDAQEQGAQLLVGGKLQPDGCITPAVLLGVTPNMQVCQQELFGPAVAIAPYDTLDEAIEQANSTPYGLQAGIFTNNLQAAFYAAERLEFGGVHINEVSSYRADHMPYGGVKASGMGREGPRYAIEEMTETKIIIITP